LRVEDVLAGIRHVIDAQHQHLGAGRGSRGLRRRRLVPEGRQGGNERQNGSLHHSPPWSWAQGLVAFLARYALAPENVSGPTGETRTCGGGGRERRSRKSKAESGHGSCRTV